MLKKILKVTGIVLSIEKVLPPNLIIEAKGEVTTSGWSKGQLLPYIYIVPPADGIYEFDFVAEAPTGPVQQVITPITAEPYKWNDFPKDLKGVKVYASSNHMTKLL